MLKGSVVEICTTYLVTTVGSSIKLAHFSVKGFLLAEDIAKDDYWFHLSELTGHRAILERSLSDLLNQEEVLTSECVESRPLLVCAAQYWHAHFLGIQNLTTDHASDFQRLMVRLFTEPRHYVNWMRLCDSSNEHGRWHMTPEEIHPPIYQASEMGLLCTAETLLDNGADIFSSVQNKWGRPTSPFVVAAMTGHVPVLELLLSRTSQIPNEDVWSTLALGVYHHLTKEKLEGLLDLLCSKGEIMGKSREYQKIFEAAAFNHISGILTDTHFS